VADDLAAIAAFIEARLAEDEALALATQVAAPGTWHAAGEDILTVNPDPYWNGVCVANASDAEAAHIIRHDPASTLRAVASTRDLVAQILAIPHSYVDGDTWFSCSQAVEPGEPGAEPGSACADDNRRGQPCDCGRDAKVRRMLTTVAARWDGHPETGPACQADPLDGGAHSGPVAEYVRLCFRNHERAGQLCEACAGTADEHGLRKVKCSECDGPAVMVTRAQWADFLARRRP
jgi:Family of unknown function (DUF6221)